MAGHAGESIIAALQFEVGVANASKEQAYESEAFGPVRLRGMPDLNLTGVEVD